MKFFVLFVATIAFASASLLGKKNIDIKEDGTIVITDETGKQIAISKKFGLFGAKDIEIEVTGPNTAGKKIQIGENNQIKIEKGFDTVTPETYDYIRSFEEDRNKRASTVESQDLALKGIFKEYQAVVDELSYQKFITKLQKAITKGKIDSSVLDFIESLNEESKWNKLVSGQPITNQVVGINTVYGQQTTVEDLLNQYYQTFGQGKQVVSAQNNIYQLMYDQYTKQLLNDVLVKIFDKQYLYTLLNQQGIFEQGLYEKEPIDMILSNILVKQGIFDKEVLIQLVNNVLLRKVLIQEGIFNQSVLEQLLYIFNTQGTYNDVLLEQLINRPVLKYFLVKQGIFKYVLGQVEKQYNFEVYGQQNVLVKLIKNPVLRNVLVQEGIFDKEVLEKVLYILNTQGIFNQLLLDQLVNKAVLRQVLTKQGIVDEAYLEQLVSNEVLGLQVLMKTQFFAQTPKFTFKQLVGEVGNVPELVNENNYVSPYTKSVYQNTPLVDTFYSTKRSTFDNIFDADQVGSNNYFKNFVYGQQGLGYKQGINQGYYYPQVPAVGNYAL